MGDFQIVKGRKRQLDRGRHFAERELIVDYIDHELSVILAKIQEAQDTFEVSDYFAHLLSEVNSCDVSVVDNIFCYGLGSFADSYISRHQLAALVAFKRHFNCPASAYDPIFSPKEIEVLQHFGIDLMSYNDEAKRKIPYTGVSLVYFAHCSSQLVNNFLWANWSSSLHNCIILSNSFSRVIARNDEATVATLSCMRDVIEICEEHILTKDYAVADAFNDLSIHAFHSSKVRDNNFWEKRPEPNYTGQTIEFCTKDVAVKLRKI